MKKENGNDMPFKADEVNWDELSGIGIMKDELELSGEMDTLLRGEKTKVMSLSLVLLGVDVVMDATLQLVRKGEAPLRQIAKDFGISEGSLANWMKQADIEDGRRPGLTDVDRAELRELKKRNRLLEQENEVLRRAAAYLSQANLPGK